MARNILARTVSQPTFTTVATEASVPRRPSYVSRALASGTATRKIVRGLISRGIPSVLSLGIEAHQELVINCPVAGRPLGATCVVPFSLFIYS